MAAVSQTCYTSLIETKKNSYHSIVFTPTHMRTSVSAGKAVNPMDEVLLMGGGILLAFGIFAFIQPSFFEGLTMSFTEIERYALVGIGATLLAIEQNTDKKMREYTLILAGAFGIAVGAANLLYLFDLGVDILNVVNTASPMNGLVYLALGMWAVSAALISEMKHRK